MTDPILLLREADPARDLEPTAAEVARMDEALDAALLRPAAPAAPAPARLRRRLALGVAAAAGLAVAVAAVTDRAPHRFAPAPASAATVLADLGRKAAAVPAQEGRYAYMKRITYSSHMRPRAGAKGSFVVVIPMEDEQWVTGDGTAIVRSVMHEDQATFPTPQDEADYERARPAPPWDQRPFELRGIKVAGFTAAEVLALPSDPQALRERLEGRDIVVTAAAGQLLGSALTPRAVKSALFAVLRRLPGARLAGAETDPTGRTGVGVEFDDAAWKTLFLFDRDTGALLGTRSIGKRELPGRTISDWDVIVDSGRRDTAPAPTGKAPQRIPG
jgi:hypothetical protein